MAKWWKKVKEETKELICKEQSSLSQHFQRIDLNQSIDRSMDPIDRSNGWRSCWRIHRSWCCSCQTSRMEEYPARPCHRHYRPSSSSLESCHSMHRSSPPGSPHHSSNHCDSWWTICQTERTWCRWMRSCQSCPNRRRETRQRRPSCWWCTEIPVRSWRVSVCKNSPHILRRHTSRTCHLLTGCCTCGESPELHGCWPPGDPFQDISAHTRCWRRSSNPRIDLSAWLASSPNRERRCNHSPLEISQPWSIKKKSSGFLKVKKEKNEEKKWKVKSKKKRRGRKRWWNEVYRERNGSIRKNKRFESGWLKATITLLSNVCSAVVLEVESISIRNPCLPIVSTADGNWILSLVITIHDLNFSSHNPVGVTAQQTIHNRKRCQQNKDWFPHTKLIELCEQG